MVTPYFREKLSSRSMTGNVGAGIGFCYFCYLILPKTCTAKDFPFVNADECLWIQKKSNKMNILLHYVVFIYFIYSSLECEIVKKVSSSTALHVFVKAAPKWPMLKNKAYSRWKGHRERPTLREGAWPLNHPLSTVSKNTTRRVQGNIFAQELAEMAALSPVGSVGENFRQGRDL